ncbi:hypothetical protein CPC08DRAFT_750151 [Agrocybe pediades]|nr:hypothetical protein CPC08DRAFT_750151 [Agrocybe pediades]
MTVGQSYGQALPDQVERISQLFDAQLEVIGDIQELYSVRVALEREYATKLQTLTRKAAEKKAKSGESYIVGNEPTKITDPTVLRQHTLDVAYNAIISSMTDTAQDHMNFADALTVQGLDVLRTVARRSEETKKKEMTFFQKLLSDRDRIYADRLKCKQKYDEECMEVESIRQKQGRASDDRHADRAARQAEQQRNEMLNSKNSYIISIAVANQVKDKFYTEDVPNLENELQSLQRRLLERMAKILSHGQTLQEQHLDALKSRISFVKEKIDQVDVVKDQDLFIDHNIRPFNAPNNWAFEPCPNHYDTEEIDVEEAPKIVIQNKLRRTQGKLAELKPLTESKRAESKLLASQITSYIPDTSVGAIDDLTDNHLEVEHQLTSYASSERILETEIKTVLGALGDDLGSSAPHSFKSSSFTIPTPCGYCKSSIWGLSRQGKTCRACGLSVHAKCELKVPANCQAASGEDLPRHSHGSIFSRKSISKSQRSEEDLTPSIAPSASSFVESSSSSHDEDVETAEVLFDFEANSEFELQVKEGQVVRIVEADDGSGWIKVADQEGNSGLVPATYLRILTDESEAVAPEDNEQKRVRALYPYTAQGPDELSIQPDEILTLSTGPTGGENYGNGWCEGYNPQGKRGIFPSNYVEHL